jgi:hypothetical protein
VHRRSRVCRENGNSVTNITFMVLVLLNITRGFPHTNELCKSVAWRHEFLWNRIFLCDALRTAPAPGRHLGDTCAADARWCDFCRRRADLKLAKIRRTVGSHARSKTKRLCNRRVRFYDPTFLFCRGNRSNRRVRTPAPFRFFCSESVLRRVRLAGRDQRVLRASGLSRLLSGVSDSGDARAIVNCAPRESNARSFSPAAPALARGIHRPDFRSGCA